MMRFAIRRLGQGLLTLVGLSLLSFLLVVAVPGSYYDEARSDPRVSTETIRTMQARAGETGSLAQRYGQWLGSMVRGEGGYSIAYQTPVLPLILPRLRKTLELAGVGLILTWLIVLALAAWAGRGSRVGIAVSNSMYAVLSAIPELVLACGLLALALHWGLLRENDIGLPAVVLGLSGIPGLLPPVRAALGKVSAAPHLLLAQVHGIRGWRYFSMFWLRAASVSLISLAGVSVGTMLSSTLVVEIVCGWPGIGALFLQSIESRDTHVVLAIVLVSSGVYSVASTVSDLLVAAADPRIREGS
ncbi:MAG: ABC transporter permease [Bryobacteraceae bacterium]